MGDRGTKVCRGACGLARPMGAFQRHAGRPDGRQPVCRDCRAGRRPEPVNLDGPLATLDPGGLAARFEACRLEFFGRVRPWDDPLYRDVRREVERRVRTTGPFAAGPIRYGWDRVEGIITRSIAGQAGVGHRRRPAG